MKQRTGKEAVELHQEVEVDIVALGSLAVGVAHMVTVQVDTYIESKNFTSATLEKRRDREKESISISPFLSRY